MEYSPFVQTTFWWLIIGQALNFLGAYSTDQVLVQRYLATKSRRDMVKAIVLNGLLSLPLTICLFSVGLGLTAYYILHPELAARSKSRINSCCTSSATSCRGWPG